MLGSGASYMDVASYFKCDHTSVLFQARKLGLSHLRKGKFGPQPTSPRWIAYRDRRSKEVEEYMVKKREERIAKQVQRENERTERVLTRAREFYKLKEGRTLAEVGKIKGVSRERVRQVLEVGVSLGLGPYPRRPLRAARVEITCPCGKKFTEYANKFPKPKHCSRACQKVHHVPKMTKEERRKHNAEFHKRYYHEVFKKLPNYRQIIRDRNRQQALRLKRQSSQT